MASLQNYYQPDDKPSEGFEPLPAGEYIAAIVDSEMKSTQSGTGEYLKLTWEVMDGKYKGRKLFENLNLQNPNAQAVEIARGTFAAIRRATGVVEPKDSVELHNIPVLIRVGVKKREDTGELQNRITSYKPKSAQQQQVAPAGVAAPWQKKVG